jgi:hypothetical protein
MLVYVYGLELKYLIGGFNMAAKKNITVVIDPELHMQMKMEAVIANKDLSAITAELYKAYIKHQKAKREADESNK